MRASQVVQLLLILWWLVGCASTDSVSKLADKTAANVATISDHLRQLDANSLTMAERRATTISRLRSSNAELRARYQYDVALTKKSGGQSNLVLLDDIKAWQTEIDQIFDATNTSETARKDAVLSSQQPLDLQTKALAGIAQMLAALAQDESEGDRVRFLAGYALSLRTQLASALEEDTASAKAAHALLDKISVTFTAGGAPPENGSVEDPSEGAETDAQ